MRSNSQSWVTEGRFHPPWLGNKGTNGTNENLELPGIKPYARKILNPRALDLVSSIETH